MTASLRVVAVLLISALAVGGCRKKAKSPWARKMSPEDRVAWMVACGVPIADVKPYDGDADYAYTSYDKRFHRDTEELSVACNVTWNRTKDQLWHISVGLGGVGEATDDGQAARLATSVTEPYTALVLREIPPEFHAAIRAVADGPVRRGVRVGPFEVHGGHEQGPGVPYWHLEIWAK